MAIVLCGPAFGLVSEIRGKRPSVRVIHLEGGWARRVTHERCDESRNEMGGPVARRRRFPRPLAEINLGLLDLRVHAALCQPAKSADQPSTRPRGASQPVHTDRRFSQMIIDATSLFPPSIGGTKCAISKRVSLLLLRGISTSASPAKLTDSRSGNSAAPSTSSPISPHNARIPFHVRGGARSINERLRGSLSHAEGAPMTSTSARMCGGLNPCPP